MKKLTFEDYASCAFFTIIAIIFFVLAWCCNAYEGTIGFTCLLGFMGLVSICFALWSLSDFKIWK